MEGQEFSGDWKFYGYMTVDDYGKWGYFWLNELQNMKTITGRGKISHHSGFEGRVIPELQ